LPFTIETGDNIDMTASDDVERENERLRWVRACAVDGAAPLPEFEAVAELAARLLGTKISIITVVT
jgi:hypothetical protein